MGEIKRFPDPERDFEDLPWSRVFHAQDLPAWLLDISAVRDVIRASAPDDPARFAAWLDVHPEFITRAVSLIGVADVNRAAVRLFAADGRRNLARSLERLVVPETLAAFKALLLAVAAGVDHVEQDAVFRSLDDRILYVQCRGWLPPPDRRDLPMVLSMVDVTDFKLATQGLERSEDRYRGILDGAGDLILRHDLNGTITFINLAGLDLLGMSREQVLGRSVQELVVPTEKTVEEKRGRGRGQPASTFYEATLRARREEPVRLEINSRLVHSPPSSTGEAQILLCGRVVPPRSASETDDVVLDARVRTVQRLESLGQLTGAVAHDFNNLLGTIMGNVELVSQTLPEQAESRTRLETALAMAREAAALCREVQVLGSDRTPVRRPQDLNDVLGGTRRLLELAVRGKAEIHILPGEAVPAVEIEAEAIRQVVMTLVINAAEACGDDGGEIAVRTGVREIFEADLANMTPQPCASAGRYVFCEIRDSGAGMAPAECVRVFDPFVTTKIAGRGLGLTSALGVVRDHGGGFCVESRPGAGTTMTFLLPPATPKRHRAAAADDDAGPLPDVSGKTVLVIEQDANLRGVAASFLRRLGCRVLAAGDGFEGVRIFGLRQAEIDAVIIDLNMPVIDGAATCRRLRVIRPEMPVVFSSGSAAEEMRERTSDLGRVGALTKPFTLVQLHRALATALSFD